MELTRSKLTAQGHVSIPWDVRKRLGIKPGSVPELEEEGEHILVLRSGNFSSEEIHLALFASKTPNPKSIAELRQGIRNYANKRFTHGSYFPKSI